MSNNTDIIPTWLSKSQEDLKKQHQKDFERHFEFIHDAIMEDNKSNKPVEMQGFWPLIKKQNES